MAFKTEDDADLVTGINVTPLVDVCLVLVIIFMVTAPLLSEPVFKVNLPAARTQEGEEKEKIVLSLAREARYAVNETAFTEKDGFYKELARVIRTSSVKLVVIKADQDAGYGLLTDVMQRSKEAGASGITIATEQKKKQS
jgi:biopolymer transport protein ExbD